ncbi:hypothetical protein YC2023_032973 [Brassica napus]
MSNSNLASPPPSMLHKILSKIATSHLRDFDLFNLNDWIDEANSLRKFRLRCYQAGNLEAIYMRYVMLNLAFSVDARGFVHNYPSFSLEFVDRMNYMYDFAWDFCNDIHLTASHWPIED